ncbi:MAG: metal-sensing transcriptional repressor [Oscillospiraceae bacterium]|nr:metal-sensing transcriptional repressor [Oscillospiraceae bacterium]
MENKENTECCCCHKTKQRSEEEYKALLNRLNRIEGQIRGIKRMLQENAYCTDIINQVAAANAALNAFNKELLSNHIKTCVTDDIKAGKEDTVDDLLRTLQKLMK